MSKINSDIAVSLDGKDFTLRSSLKAATAISQRFGGLNEAFAALSRAQIDAYVFIIRAGLPKDEAKQLGDDLPEAVWRTGLDSLAEPVARFVNRLRNGGREPGLIDDDDDQEEGAVGNDPLHV